MAPSTVVRVDGRPLSPGAREATVPIEPGRIHTLELSVAVRSTSLRCHDGPGQRCSGGAVRHWLVGNGRYRRHYAYVVPVFPGMDERTRLELSARWPSTFEHQPTVTRPGVANEGYFMARRPSGVEHGPFLAAGGVVGQGALIQAGYDISWPHGRRSRSTGIVIDVAPSHSVTLTPMFELVAPLRTGLFTSPSFTVGVGLPVDVWPRATPGLRLQGSIYAPFISLAVLVDFMPFTRDVRTAVVGRVSL
jgi:hypothetical protein